MDLRQLRYFVAIVRSGSISRAALHLNIAQPALSLHIRNMEADLGTTLLLRTPQGVRPTAAGAVLLRSAIAILDQVEQVQDEIRGNHADAAGEVRLGLPGSISDILGVPLVLAARERFPRITLRVGEAMSGYVLEWLRLGRVDLGILYHAVEEPGFRSTALLTEELLLCGPGRPPHDHAQPPDGAIPFARLATLPLILPSPGQGLRDLLDSRAAARNLRLTSCLDIDSYGAIKALAERGLGYAILPAHALRNDIDRGGLRSWPIDPPQTRTLHLVQAADRPASGAVRAIEDLCGATLRELVQAGAWSGAQVRMIA